MEFFENCDDLRLAGAAFSSREFSSAIWDQLYNFKVSRFSNLTASPQIPPGF